MPEPMSVGGLHFLFDASDNKAVDMSLGHPTTDPRYIMCRAIGRHVVRLRREQLQTLKTIWRMRFAGTLRGAIGVEMTWLEFRKDMWLSSSRAGCIVVPHAYTVVYIGPRGEMFTWDDKTSKQYVADIIQKDIHP